jgi:hypothetical protein
VNFQQRTLRAIQAAALAATLAASALAIASPVADAATVSSASAGRCFGYTWSDTSGDAHLDAVRYGLDYNCTLDRWTAWAQTPAAFPASRVASFDIGFDIDHNSATGCHAVEWRLAVAYSAASHALHATGARYSGTSCTPIDQTGPLQVYGDQARGANTIEVSGVGGPIPYDRNLGFRWFSHLADTAGGTADRMPNGTSLQSYTPTGTTAFLDRSAPNVSGSYQLTSGDFDGDGNGDILFYGVGTAPDAIWQADPVHVGFHGIAVTINGSYDQILAGDYNGDGRDDLLLYKGGTGADGLLFGNANATFTPRALTIGGTYTRLVSGDYNGDGRDDVLFYRAGTGADYIWLGNANGTFTGIHLTISGTYDNVVSGDFNGDTFSDILFYRAGAGTDYLWRGSANATFTGASLPINGYYQSLVVGDFNSDARDDLLLYSHDTGADYIWLGHATAPYFVSGPAVTLNESYTTVVAGKYDGNSSDDLFCYQTSTPPERWWVSTL